MGGPLFAAFLMENYGAMGIFVATGSAHAAYAAYTLYRTTRRQSLPAEIRDDFQSTPLARTQTPATFALDPRAEVANEIATAQHDDEEGFPPEAGPTVRETAG